MTYADGSEERVCPGGFGEVVALSVDDDALVDPGDSLLDFVERAPTLAEWLEQHEIAEGLRRRAYELREQRSYREKNRERRRRQNKRDEPDSPEFVLWGVTGELGNWPLDAPRLSWQVLQARDEDDRKARRERIERAQRFDAQRRDREDARRAEILEQADERRVFQAERSRELNERFDARNSRMQRLEQEFLAAVAESQGWELHVQPLADGWRAAFVAADTLEGEEPIGYMDAPTPEEAVAALARLAELSMEDPKAGG